MRLELAYEIGLLFELLVLLFEHGLTLARDVVELVLQRIDPLLVGRQIVLLIDTVQLLLELVIFKVRDLKRALGGSEQVLELLLFLRLVLPQPGLLDLCLVYALLQELDLGLELGILLFPRYELCLRCPFILLDLLVHLVKHILKVGAHLVNGHLVHLLLHAKVAHKPAVAGLLLLDLLLVRLVVNVRELPLQTCHLELEVLDGLQVRRRSSVNL
mmetsp:Transcript_10695/g.25151  ORF Transcript_10695/g.25151 Transcript_10695/m.25151 type:complete len:215 (+) Transcript_10695:2272-2916(+)